MFGSGNQVAKRVTSVINQRIKEAQVKFNLESKSIDEEVDVKIAELRTEAEGKRMDTLDALVSSIIGK